MKPPKPKKCSICKQPFHPWNTLQKACSIECAKTMAEHKREKEERKSARIAKQERAEGLKKLKALREYIKELQVIFNAFIRLRDAEDGCISCDRPASWNGQWHASHFFATSIRPNLRFNENNVHKACSICNNYMHGNLTPYREKLILKIGIEEFNILESSIEPAKFTIPQIEEMKEYYAKRIKELRNQMPD